MKIIKRYYLKTSYFLFLGIENYFFVIKYVFFIFYYEQQKTILKNNYLTNPKSFYISSLMFQ